LEITEELRRAIDRAVTRSLRAALDERGLLLAPEVAIAAAAEIDERGGVLLRRTLAHCYGDGRQLDQGVRVEFGDSQVAARIGPALTFGSVTAGVLAPRAPAEGRLLCGVFNLGIGLVDGLCDGAPQLGLPFLDTLEGVDVAGAARTGWPRGRLLAGLPTSLADDPTVAFAARVIEVFFDLLHTAHPGPDDAELRHQVGARLAEALAAEGRSVGRIGSGADPERLIEASRLTSVLPFRIIEQLATEAASPIPTSAGSSLGEAMWRIDDLVDLVEDARAGALNALLLGAPGDPAGGLERILEAGVIPVTAAEAARHLAAGLTWADAGSATDRRLFLALVQRYAGIGSDDLGLGP
jgi:hypothetical protein